MPLVEHVDDRIWFVLGVLLLAGFFALLHYRLRKQLDRNIEQLHLSQRKLRQMLDEDRESAELYYGSLSSEFVSVGDNSRIDVEQLKQEIEALREALEADISQLADVVVSLEDRSVQDSGVEPVPNTVSRMALYTLRADVDKLRAEVLALQTSRGVRPQPLKQQAGDRQPKLPRMEKVLGILDEKNRDGLPVGSEIQNAVN